MKHLPVILACLLLLAGCKKAKDAVLEETALNLLHGTEWAVTSFVDGGTDVSPDFDRYIFRFNRNLTVEAILNNATVASGTWEANIANRTIYANFPAGTPHPLTLLNATWSITRSTLQSLSATATAGSQLRELKMEKR